jgi:transposase
MPTGNPIPQAIRRLLLYHCLILQSDTEFVYKNLFIGDDIDINTIEVLWKEFPLMDDTEKEYYVSDHKRKRKRHMLETGEDPQLYLQELLESSRSMKLRILMQRFHDQFYDEYFDQMPSLSTVYRAVTEVNSHKKVAWANIQKDPLAQQAFLDNIAHVPASCIIDIDGMVQTPDDFYERYGWSPPGEECKRMQIHIGSRTFAVHAAYTELGSIAWDIFEGSVTDNEVKNFVNRISLLLEDDSYGLFDNASNQRTDAVRIMIETVFRGLYIYCSPYSPELKPIERGFVNVKTFIRERDDDAEWIANPVGLISAAFQNYRVGTPGGLAAYNHFEFYRENHENYMNAA